ncbi:MAG: site-specific integrase [Oscillospiraceae bacterium]|nr:site-specific integrase [Oscillospiraceae bacterium]
MNEFFKAIRKYLTEYLPNQRCCSNSTINSYRHALNLLVTYLTTERHLKITQINFDIFNRPLILGYLDWLEHERDCSAATRNQRLAALRSFFRYAGMLDCAQISLSLDMADVPRKKEAGRLVEFLSEPALEALLKQPNIRNHTGIRNQFFMILMYDTAARCGELLDMRVRDLKIHTQYPLAYLKGKGDKARTVPLLPKTVEHCNRFLQLFHNNSQCSNDYLFFTQIHNARHPMSPDTVAAFMKQYGRTAHLVCPECPEHIHPHMLRHTRAMHLYREGIPMVLLSEYLGHVSVETTKVYAFADTEMKRAAIQKAEGNQSSFIEPIWKDNEDMILKLSGLRQ